MKKYVVISQRLFDGMFDNSGALDLDYCDTKKEATQNSKDMNDYWKSLGILTSEEFHELVINYINKKGKK